MLGSTGSTADGTRTNRYSPDTHALSTPGARAIVPRVAAVSTSSITPQPELLEAARGGDENAFRQIIEPYHGELQAHCHRMLGSPHDAADALQDALLLAWRALPRFEGRRLLRPRLYKIPPNPCLHPIPPPPKRGL